MAISFSILSIHRFPSIAKFHNCPAATFFRFGYWVSRAAAIRISAMWGSSPALLSRSARLISTAWRVASSSVSIVCMLFQIRITAHSTVMHRRKRNVIRLMPKITARSIWYGVKYANVPRKNEK